MTTKHASDKLFEWFLNNDGFCLDTDFLKLIIVTNNEDIDKAAITCALNTYKSLGFIDNVNIKNKEIWVLKQPLQECSQTIQISSFVASALSRIINTLTQEEGLLDKSYTSNPLALEEKDILIILQIINTLITLNTQEVSEQEVMPKKNKK